MHYMFVSQTAQILALFDVFLSVGVETGVPAPLMAFALLFDSSYFSTITPQEGVKTSSSSGAATSRKANSNNFAYSLRFSVCLCS
jgi:hypothetical protein